MRPVLLWALSSLLWTASVFTFASARDVGQGFSEHDYRLSPRQDAGCGGYVTCCPCSGSTCGASKLKRDSSGDDFWLFDHYDTNNNLSETLHGSEHELRKRKFRTVTAKNVGQYLSNRAVAAGAIDVGFRTDDAGNQISATTLQRFISENGDVSNGITIGLGGGYLTGCSVLAIVSSRAVYMGHFWQCYGFPPNPDDPDAVNEGNFQQNVLNLIGGQTPLHYAGGDAFDVSLFNQPGDNPVAFWLTPRSDAEEALKDANPPDDQANPQLLWYYPETQQLQQYLAGLLDTITFMAVPYISEQSYPSNQQYRGRALFEYDPNADGNGNGNWRLFYEQNVEDGRSRGQDVFGKNNPPD